MDVTRAIQAGVVRADMAICGAGYWLKCALVVALAAAAMWAVLKWL